MTEALVHDHLSGRFTATHDQEEAALDAAMAHSHEVTTTEVSANVRARCLREPGWWAVFGDKGPRDDCGVAGRTDRLELLEGDTEVLSDLTYVTERGRQSARTVGAYAVTRDHATGKVGVTVVVHMPHGMQDELRTGRIVSDVARAYRDIVKGTRRLANRLARKWEATWTMIVGDLNINIKRAWTRAYLLAQFPNFRPNWSPPYPGAGTWGPLIIDVGLLRRIRVVSGPRVQPRHAGFDHHGFEEALA